MRFTLRGDRGEGQCPCHNDHRPSLTFEVGKVRPVVGKCQACGATLPEVLDKLGASADERAAILGGRRDDPSRSDAPSAAHVYTDAAGQPLFRVLRYDSPNRRSFPQERWTPRGWERGLADTRRVPYHLTQSIEAIARGETIYIPEGEKCVEALEALGLAATCNPGGAGKWRAEYTELLRKAPSVTVFEDNDEPGRKHADQIASSFQAAGVPVRVVGFPGQPQGYDIADWLAERAEIPVEERRAQLSLLIDGVPLWSPKATSVPASTTRPKQGRALALQDPEPWPEPVDGASLIGEFVATFKRHLALPPHADMSLALWALNAHAHDAATVSPILALSSPEKRCGKSTALHILSALVPRALMAASITPASLFRAVESYGPTLLVDEADTFLRENDELRGLLNAGHTRRGAVVIRTTGDDFEPRAFSTWCPKAIALIGRLPGTLEDRSILLTMRRRAPHEKVERLRLDRLHELEPLRRRAARWALDHLEALRQADPTTPEALHDRAADNWRPLLAIADLAAEEWHERARAAALALSGGDAVPDGSTGELLLGDISEVFDSRRTDRLSSADLVDALAAREDRPWAEWRQGKPLSKNGLARLLKPFGIFSSSVRIGDSTPKGYHRDCFEEAWRRYLPLTPTATTQQLNADAAEMQLSQPQQDDACCACCVSGNGVPLAPDAACGDVADSKGGEGAARVTEAEVADLVARVAAEGPGVSAHSRFVVALKDAYERGMAAYCHTGLNPEQVHRQAFADVKALGTQALVALRDRGLYPFQGTGPLLRSSECGS
jgi:putative DNA primase/helicase